MPISDLPVLSALKTRMQWQQERQRVLAENVANSDTPGFRPRDLVEPKIGRRGVQGDFGELPVMRTSANHLSASGGDGRFAVDRKGGYETRPAGNAVNIEDQMLKTSANQMDFATASTLYGRSLGLIKTAIGKR